MSADGSMVADQTLDGLPASRRLDPVAGRRSPALHELEVGMRAIVGGPTSYDGTVIRLLEMGLTPGAEAAVRVLDLPGTYSLVPRSEDEVVAIQGLLGRLPLTARPAVTIAVVDATNLERNLYLVEQLFELGGNYVVALTMMDTVQADGVT